MNPMFKSREVVSRGSTNPPEQTNSADMQSSETSYQSSGSPLLLYYWLQEYEVPPHLRKSSSELFEKRFKPWYSPSTLSITRKNKLAHRTQTSKSAIMKFLPQFMNPLCFPCAESQVQPGITTTIMRPPPNCKGEKIMNAGRRVFVPIVIVFFPPLRRFYPLNASMCNSRGRACR